ncbi:DNA sulfur modification protein DndB [Desulforhabdus sp. TSK]|uniref:DNA sulfur modification protein DndB n=1 Tax=Desulforhabdus sp. TSK TaxID=2925014 RepID=UPI001FC8906D|nr:DNA sulfur modification protein DndB [Desulforhabdus sp. TSK]GKT09161.1 hypothetical protein DSTSK_24660 [Desulforhabdus sp. TSK]
MAFKFGVQKSQIFGTYGEFAVGSDDDRVRAQFLLTKMRPGSEGTWENEFASQMVPWREMFKVEELTFDELLQRDLDDSRVAHDLIPYLLGDKGDHARFFPPVLAVLVPKRTNLTGILPYYPVPQNGSDDSISFGDLFDFQKIKFNGDTTPLGVIEYNRHKAGFVIVDGQHRAMAVLALHRQLTTWGGDRYASYYNHIPLQAKQVENIELPVCVIFLPDLHEGKREYYEKKSISLKEVCREIFLVVNKTAKKVSESRQLLLDDEDFAARMMRATLSKLKGRGEEDATCSRIYSFAFGDSDSDLGKQVVSGQLEYSTAVALYKMHCAVSFGMPDAFNLENPSDITDLRRTKNPSRPVELLKGSSLAKLKALSRFSAKYMPSDDVKIAVGLLSEVGDIPLLKLFDKFRPLAIHNAEMRALRTRLSDPDLRADPIQSKCFSLLFEGSGVLNVFIDHHKRLKEKEKELIEEGSPVGDYVKNQLKDAEAVLKALDRHERMIKERRSAKLFSINPDKFFSQPGNEVERTELISIAKSIFDTIATQAFQLGYLMAVHSIVEAMINLDDYDKRITVINFVSDMYVKALNTYFSPGSETEHHTFAGYVKEPRAGVFATDRLGLRGLLSLSVRELNEKQWVFFRYAILEIVHSKYSFATIHEGLNSDGSQELKDAYLQCLPGLIQDVVKLRNGYIEKAVHASLGSPTFTREIELLKAELKGKGKTEDEVNESVSSKKKDESARVRVNCEHNIIASLGETATAEVIVQRLAE